MFDTSLNPQSAQQQGTHPAIPADPQPGVRSGSLTANPRAVASSQSTDNEQNGNQPNHSKTADPRGIGAKIDLLG